MLLIMSHGGTRHWKVWLSTYRALQPICPVSDYNSSEVADAIKDAVTAYAAFTPQEAEKIRHKAADISEHALWKHFIRYYYQAYDIALHKAKQRRGE